jgi:hypothetical protein
MTRATPELRGDGAALPGLGEEEATDLHLGVAVDGHRFRLERSARAFRD